MLSHPLTATSDRLEELLGPFARVRMLSSACSSGANAILVAATWILSGELDVVVAGASDGLCRLTWSGFQALSAMDPEPCRPFDRNRRGMSLGEGAGVLVLERLEQARRRGAQVLALVAGGGLACDAYHLTAPDPEGRGAARAMRAALGQAGIGPEAVGFINAHGTGTPHNDRAELASVREVFGPHARACPLSTVKGHIGHCLGAAGAIEAVVTLETLRCGLVPPTAGLTDPELEGEIDFVRGTPRPVVARYGLTNSFGFGGNDASLVLASPEVAL
jgi:3-oxoacyl-[acyl-carrier-protein] synthase II